MNTNTNTKKPSPKSSPHPSPNGADLNQRVHNPEIDNAAMKAGKLDWLAAVKAQATIIAFILTIMGGVFGFIYSEMKEVKNDLAIVQRTLDQILYIAKQNADPETLNAINGLFNDASIDATNDATSDAGDATTRGVASKFKYYAFLVDADGKTYYVAPSNINA